RLQPVRPPEGGTPYQWRDPDGFMVPMHGRKADGAFHEPERRAGASAAPVRETDGKLAFRLARRRSAGRRDACPTLAAARFTVPIHPIATVLPAPSRASPHVRGAFAIRVYSRNSRTFRSSAS